MKHLINKHTHTHTHNSFMTLIGMREMHPKHALQVRIPSKVRPPSPSGYFTVTYTHPIAGNLPKIKRNWSLGDCKQELCGDHDIMLVHTCILLPSWLSYHVYICYGMVHAGIGMRLAETAGNPNMEVIYTHTQVY